MLFNNKGEKYHRDSRVITKPLKPVKVGDTGRHEIVTLRQALDMKTKRLARRHKIELQPIPQPVESYKLDLVFDPYNN
jgi:hypothetical protein